MSSDDLPPWRQQTLYDDEVEAGLARDRAGYRKGPSAREKVNVAVRQLEKADTFSESVGWKTKLVPGLTVEEVVGTLLHVQEELEESDE